MKICSVCKIEKDDNCFNKRQTKCKECHKKYDKIYREENKNKITEYKNEWYQKNKDVISTKAKIFREENSERIKEDKRKYYQENKTQIMVHQNQYQRERRKNDPVFNMRMNISGIIGKLLKQNNSSKNGSSCLQYLPYSFQELKAHLEHQFEPWMTWQNYGKYNSKTWNDDDRTTWTWQIDHIIPHSTFQYASMDCQEFQDCWSLNNLRPYSSKQNWLDGTNRIRHKGKI